MVLLLDFDGDFTQSARLAGLGSVVGGILREHGMGGDNMTFNPHHTGALPTDFDPLFPTLGWIEEPIDVVSVIRGIQDEVCNANNISFAELIGPDRYAGLVKIRHYAIRLVYRLTGETALKIGVAFDRERTTILRIIQKQNAG